MSEESLRAAMQAPTDPYLDGDPVTPEWALPPPAGWEPADQSLWAQFARWLRWWWPL